MKGFILKSEFKPTGDQPQAIRKLVTGVKKNYPRQTLIGVTGSGKTFTMANVIAKLNIPTLVISHNKTLAAQLYSELRSFFPENRVEYFVSYYDYYQPEAYLPVTDTYIEKDSDINEKIDRMRLSATAAILSRRDVIIVASVSCIYGLGSPGEYEALIISLKKDEVYPRDELLKKLIDVQYQRNDTNPVRGTFSVKGNTIDIIPSYKEEILRVEFDIDDRIIDISIRDPLTRKVLEKKEYEFLFPAKHFVTTPPRKEQAIISIRKELAERLDVLRKENKLVEAQRLEQRTNYDLEMIEALGYCSGIENYSRHFSGRNPGEPPYTLLDYFKDPFLVIIDESHVTLPQIHGMFNGDRARKKVLVEYGFRLPSALDNRPLTFDEFDSKIKKMIFVSATPGSYELKVSKQIVEQFIRPTGVLDPIIKVLPVETQVDDLVKEIKKRAEKNERTLVTTLTKNMAEALSDYLMEKGIKVTYLHSDIDTIERASILKSLREGKIDVIVGINLLREGLDLPEVSLVAILDADKEGFLRSETSLIQTMGRAARNQFGEVRLYADKITKAMKNAISTINRRRNIQEKYNKEHNITPQTIKKNIKSLLPEEIMNEHKKIDPYLVNLSRELFWEKLDLYEGEMIIEKLTNEMEKAAKNLEFEKAALLRDTISDIQSKISKPVSKNKKRKSR